MDAKYTVINRKNNQIQNQSKECKTGMQIREVLVTQPLGQTPETGIVKRLLMVSQNMMTFTRDRSFFLWSRDKGQ
jgi:hypothetical protein